VRTFDQVVVRVRRASSVYRSSCSAFFAAIATGARRSRHIRSHFLFRDSADARNWCPHGARRTTARCPPARDWPCAKIGRHRDAGRAHTCHVLDARAFGVALQCWRVRPGDVCHSRIGPLCRSHCSPVIFPRCVLLAPTQWSLLDTMDDALIRLHHVERSYPLGRSQFFYVLRDINLDIAEGDFCIDHGPVRRRQIDAAAHSRHARSRLDRRIFSRRSCSAPFETEKSERHCETSRLASSFSSITCLMTSRFTRNLDIPLSYRRYSKKRRRARTGGRHARSFPNRRQKKKICIRASSPAASSSSSALRRAIIAGPKLLLADEPHGQSALQSRRRDHESFQETEQRRHDHRAGHALREECLLRPNALFSCAMAGL